MAKEQDFQPQWISAPGETIRDLLTLRSMTFEQLAGVMRKSPSELDELISGRRTITIEDARLLVTAFGGGVDYWVARDFQYREDAIRLRANEREWISSLPLSEMIRFGWIKPPVPAEEVEACLSYFGVSSISEWNSRFAQLQSEVAFRTSKTFDSSPAAVAAWLRQAEIVARRRHCAQWNAARFSELVVSLRDLMRQKDPQIFVPALVEKCASCGVALVVLRAPAGCKASGATRFIADDRALLVLSGRYLKDDQFWFTFLHECGHLLLHAKERQFIEGLGGVTSQEECEANEFAFDVLIPNGAKAEFLSLPSRTKEIVRFAVRHRLPPGVVVGQLQHHEKLPPNRLNALKRTYSWAGDRLVLRERA